MPIHEQTVYPNRNKFTIPNVCKTVNTTKAANAIIIAFASVMVLSFLFYLIYRISVTAWYVLNFFSYIISSFFCLPKIIRLFLQDSYFLYFS